ncbi:MAG: nucleotide exchange factor GrpE [Clostridia bacterium]|nr:nucleotide exchange factor GrpE [Clostridia bacterium]
MSKNKEKNLNENEEPVTEETVQEVSTAELEKQLEEANKALAELNDKYLRIMAEYENYRRRTAKEKEESTSYAFSVAALNFLPLADNFERAVGYAPDDENVTVLFKQLTEILEKMNIKPFNSDGEKFDPNLHNAVMHEDDPDKDENVVVQTFIKGYKIGDKVLRHAMVKVAN